jgi:hypothetical protein
MGSVRLLLAFVAAMAGVASVSAQPIVARVTQEAQRLAACMKALDTDCVVGLSDIDSFKRVSQGAFDFATTQRQIFEGMRRTGSRYSSFDVTAPRETFADLNGHLYAFVPYVRAGEFFGQPFKVTSYFIGTSADAGASWKFFDAGQAPPKDIRLVIPGYTGQPPLPSGGSPTTPPLVRTAPDEPYWTPDAGVLAKLEAGLKISPMLHQTTFQLAQYDRYYAGVTINQRRAVRGRLIVPPNRDDHPKTGIHVTDMKYMPQLLGGGCANVNVTYWVDQDHSSAQCSLTDGYAPRSQQPHWKPDEATALIMEVTMQEFLRRTHPVLPELSQFSRYYWGVTIDGRPTVVGRVLRLSGEVPGMHLAVDSGDGPMMVDGRCTNIRVAFDVRSAKLTEMTCDGERQFPL